MQVGDVARERHRRDADVLVVLEEDRHARAARVGDAVPVRRGPDHRAADDFDLVLRFQRVDRRLDGGEPQAEPPRELGAGQLARKVHVLQRELKEQVERQARLLEGDRRRRVRQHLWHVEMFGSHVQIGSRCPDCGILARPVDAGRSCSRQRDGPLQAHAWGCGCRLALLNRLRG